MKTVSVAEARRRFKALLDEVSSGHPVSVVRRGQEVARLLPPKPRRVRLPALGSFRASIRVTGEPLSRTVIRERAGQRLVDPVPTSTSPDRRWPDEAPPHQQGQGEGRREIEAET